MLQRWALFSLLTILFLGLVSPARAEELLRISTMDVSVWPEYDQPGVLVQYQGNLTAKADKANPLELSFFVPKGAGITAACAIQSNGNHTSETWKESEAEDRLTKITFQVTEPQFHVEYYYNPLPSSTDRKFEFAYTAALAADQVQLDIQHPLKATNFVLTPDAPNSHLDQDGFTYHAYVFKPVTAGQKLAAEVAYTKTDPKPSVSGNKPAAVPSAANTPSDSGINPNQVIVLTTFLAMAAIIAYFIWERNHRPAPSTVRAASYNAAPRRGEPSSGGYCTQCGNAMQPEDRFCARCGNPVMEI